MEQTLTIENGAKAVGTFSREEMEARVSGLRKALADQSLDAAFFTSMHNIAYYSDFLYCSFGRSYGLVVTYHRHSTVSAKIDGGQPWRRSFGDNLVYTDWQRDNFYRAVKSLIGPAKRLGVEFDHLTLEARAKLEAAMPEVTLVDIAPLVMRQRMIKSSEEHAVIRDGAAVADIGGWAVVEAMGEGVPEHEVALAGTAAMTREIAKRYPHSEIRDTWVWFQSGLNTDGAHNPVTTRSLQAGDILSLNCFPMIQGYYTALERTLFLGHASDAHLKHWEVNCEVHRRGLELIKPGMRCCDIAAELNEIYASHDLLQYRSFGYGHSFGVLSHYYGREAALELREDIETALEPGMVVSMEPMITIPEGQPGAGGYREHDILIVTEAGAENITGFPFGPDRNIVPLRSR